MRAQDFHQGWFEEQGKASTYLPTYLCFDEMCSINFDLQFIIKLRVLKKNPAYLQCSAIKSAFLYSLLDPFSTKIYHLPWGLDKSDFSWIYLKHQTKLSANWAVFQQSCQQVATNSVDCLKCQHCKRSSVTLWLLWTQCRVNSAVVAPEHIVTT